MYGSPERSERQVETITLDLPRAVSSVEDLDSDPAVKVYGPLAEGEGPEDADTVHVPSDVDVHGSVVEFTFETPLERGRYWVTFYQTRVKADNEEPFELFNDDGSPFVGWELQVLNVTPRHRAEGGEQEIKDRPAPGGPRLKQVMTDGEAASSVQLSGETLTVVTTEQAEVDLIFRPLLKNARRTLYERHVTKTSHTVDGNPAVTFASAGPIGDYQWARYHGTDTTGRLPLDKEGNLAWATPVMREPTEAHLDPLVSGQTGTRQSTDDDGTTNTYDELRLDVTPQSPSAPIGAYESRPLLWPNTINGNNTPEENPRLFPEAVYHSGAEFEGTDERVAAFDLPLHTEVIVEVNGRRVWSGQTRLVPTLLSIPHYERELGITVEDRAQALQTIWQASLEAIRLWGCNLPKSGPTSAMQEFVLTYAASPPDRTSGTQGQTSSQMGDQSVDAKSDRSAERRLQSLADLLRDCKASAPLYPEDRTPTESAGVAENAPSEYYKPQPLHRVARRIAPLSSPERWHQNPIYRSEYHRLTYTRS